MLRDVYKTKMMVLFQFPMKCIFNSQLTTAEAGTFVDN